MARTYLTLLYGIIFVHLFKYKVRHEIICLSKYTVNQDLKKGTTTAQQLNYLSVIRSDKERFRRPLGCISHRQSSQYGISADLVTTWH